MSAAKTGTIVFDLDGTLCTNTFGEYERAEPDPWAIERVNRLAEAGHRIIVFTARGTATGIDWGETTRAQLAEWGLRYDELHFGKPSADVYVDDRAIHTGSWRWGDAFTAPGFPLSAGEGLPPLPPSSNTAVTEVGRTFAGTALKLGEHALRAVALASAAGIPAPPAAEEIDLAVSDALAGITPPGEGDIVYRIVITAPEPAPLKQADLELDPAGPRAAFTVQCRPLAELAGNGLVEDLGGTIAIGADRRLTLPSPGEAPASVPATWLAALARRAGLDVGFEDLGDGLIAECDEAMLVGMPYCLVPIAALAGRTLPAGAPGPLTADLLAAWSEDAGVDLAGQIAGPAS